MEKYKFRWLLRSDIEPVLAIEKQKPNPILLFPDDFSEILKRKYTLGMVAEDPEHYTRILGFVIYELLKTKLRVLHYGITNQDVMTSIVIRLIKKLSYQRRSVIEFDVPAWDLATQVQLRELGLFCSHTILDVVSGEELYVFEHHYDDRTKLVKNKVGRNYLQIVD